MLNDDYKDMLRALSGEGASFLLVGAYALADIEVLEQGYGVDQADSSSKR